MALGRFTGGAHPPPNKEIACSSPIVRARLPKRLLLPMIQHVGAPCTPVVSPGEKVERGQVVGDVEATISAPVHSPVRGEVVAIGRARLISGAIGDVVEISLDETQDFSTHVRIPSAESLSEIVRLAGITGLGGGAFPSSVKLHTQHGSIHTVILNGCECEPYLTCDDRLMREEPERILAGGRMVRDAVGAKRLIVGIESNKQKAIEAMEKASGNDVEVHVFETKYPQGAEKQLIFSALGKEVPHGKLPSAIGVLVHNVQTAAAIADAVDRGKPLMERVITVTGQVNKPSNFLALLGTPVAHLIEAAGGLGSGVSRVVAGGPMTGTGLADFEVGVVKGTSGLVALAQRETAPAVMGDQPCIRCASCVDACPVSLEPYAIGLYANKGDWDTTGKYHALSCIECGCCDFVCPTNRPLLQLIRAAKQALLLKGSSA